MPSRLAWAPLRCSRRWRRALLPRFGDSRGKYVRRLTAAAAAAATAAAAAMPEVASPMTVTVGLARENH